MWVAKLHENLKNKIETQIIYLKEMEKLKSGKLETSNI